MSSPLVADALVVVALTSFYAGLARDFGATAELLDRRLSVGLSLGGYVAGGVGALLAVATVAVEVSTAGPGLLGVAATAVGLGLLFAVVLALCARAGVAVYAVLLRAGFGLSRG